MAGDPYKLDDEQEKKRKALAMPLDAEQPSAAQAAPLAAPGAQQSNTFNNFAGRVNAMAPPKPPPVAMGRAPSPTNFTNFSRRFNANADVAKREAGEYAEQAQGKVNKAAAALGAAQEKFKQGVNTGTVQGPDGAPSTNTGGGAAVPPPSNAAPVPAQTQPQGGGAAPEGDAGSSSDALTGEPTKGPGLGGPSIEEMLANAGKQYAGPDGLETKDAALAAEQAEQQLNALKDPNGIQALVGESGGGSYGADALSGALIGSAGRSQFDALRAKFNPNKDIVDAQKKAGEEAKKAKADSEANSKAWGDKAANAKKTKDELDAMNAANDAAAKARRDNAPVKKDPVPPWREGQEYTGSNNYLYGVDPSDATAMRARVDKYTAFTKAMEANASDGIRSAMSDASIVSRVWEGASGGNDPFTGAAQGLHMATEGDKPNASGGIGQHIWWKPHHFWVYNQMDDAQWKELRSLTPRKQGEWLDKRAHELGVAAAADEDAPKVSSKRS